MKPCPDCTVPLKTGAVTCACGWRAPEAAKRSTSSTTAPEDRTRCAYELLGQRCGNPWVIGRNGRRYCREHDPRGGVSAIGQHVPGGVGDFDALRKLVDAAAPIPRAHPVKRPAIVTGPARPVFELASAQVERFGHVSRDVDEGEPVVDAWPEGRE